MEIKVLASSSKGNCYRVTDGSSPLLLECGLPFKQIREGIGYEVAGLTACLVTHEHGDHAKAAHDMLKAGVDCYMSQGTADVLGIEGHRLHIVKARAKFALATWTVLPFETVHDAAEPLGFLLQSGDEKVLFATDTAYLRYRFPGCTRLMVECNYDLPVLRENVESGRVARTVKSRVLRSHMSLETLCGFLSANDLSRVREIVLLHLSDDSSDAARFKRTVQALTGKEVKIADA